MTPAALPPRVLAPASVQAQALAEVSWVLIVGAAVVFLVTMAALVWALKARRRPAVPDGVWIWGAGLAFPVAVLAALLVYATWRTVHLDDRTTQRPLVVSLTAHRWWWEVRVHDPASGQTTTLANELHLPVGRPVQLGLGSADVIHSVWVPSLGGKMDAVPGRVNRLRITATSPGVHHGLCAEYCGTQHARMGLRVVVHEPKAHAQWLAREARPADAPATALARQGLEAFRAQGCAACHAVRGHAPGAGRDGGPGTALGPDLTHVGSRLTLGAGTLRNQPGAFAAWITGVQSLKQGAHMPSFKHLDPVTVQSLSAYLASLQ